MKVFILLSCIAAAYASVLDAGIETSYANFTDGTGRIINGIEANQGQFPWQVGIFHTVGGSRQFCGGALITDQWVLTAGHCVYNANNFEIILGASRAYDPQNGKITVGALKALYHPQYNYPSSLNNDVALIKLSQRVTLNNYIRTIRLPQANDFLGGNSFVYVSGWGKTSDQQNSIVNNLNYVGLYTITNQQCKQYFQSNLILDNVVCCDGKQIKSTCNGDSGGPLIQQASNGEWVHVGVVSFVSSKGCAQGAPSGFARTASFLNFIYANID